METAMQQAHAEPVERDQRHIPLKVSLCVWATLIVLTLITVTASRIDLGALNVWIALGIATVKAVLVLLFFMHMIYERPMNFVVLFTALLFVFIFISIAILDTSTYHPDLIPDYAPDMKR
ncbi:MAG TPA: cytochrome C oxidase subunit IV family protein [Planctomycetota bacterium]|jgi:cytochrome c oxidase subunit 4